VNPWYEELHNIYIPPRCDLGGGGVLGLTARTNQALSYMQAQYLRSSAETTPQAYSKTPGKHGKSDRKP
jgi:hypothetical protein